jgi:hypothetical protein
MFLTDFRLRVRETSSGKQRYNREYQFHALLLSTHFAYPAVADLRVNRVNVPLFLVNLFHCVCCINFVALATPMVCRAGFFAFALIAVPMLQVSTPAYRWMHSYLKFARRH